MGKADTEEDVETKTPTSDIKIKTTPVVSNPDYKGPQQEKWFVKYWRPSAAYVYLVLIVFDFILAPIGTGVLSGLFKIAYLPWAPLTLQGGGLIHITFGVILGLYTFGRTQENLKKLETN